MVMFKIKLMMIF